jgi:hypothetical protein
MQGTKRKGANGGPGASPRRGPPRRPRAGRATPATEISWSGRAAAVSLGAAALRESADDEVQERGRGVTREGGLDLDGVDGRRRRSLLRPRWMAPTRTQR